MEAAQPLDQLVAGAEVQVVAVAEDDRGAERAQLVRVDELDRRLRADRHERRGRYVAVRRAQDACARGAFARGHGERRHVRTGRS